MNNTNNLHIKDILKEKLEELLDQKDAIIQEIEEFERLLAPNIFAELVNDITNSIKN